MLGKGDVGRVYLVREKKSDKLYAMKGNNKIFFFTTPPLWRGMLIDFELIRSALQARND